MKTLFAALILSTLAAPVLAMDIAPFTALGASAADVLVPSADEFDRRSGNCPKRGARVIGREGTTCGGV